MRHGLKHVQGLVGHAGFGVGFEESEGHILRAGAVDRGDDAWCVGEEEAGVGGHAAEDVVEDGGGGAEARAAYGSVEDIEGGKRGFFGFEELEKTVG